MRYSDKTMKEAEGRVRAFIKKESRLPNTLDMKAIDDGKVHSIPKEYYCGMFFNNYTFWHKNGRFPNYVTLNTKKSSPIILDYQDTGYTCCPTSLAMVSTKLFNPHSEVELRKILGTTSDGTPPANLINNAPKAGFVVKRMDRNPKAVQSALNKYHGVMVHYQTKPATCSGFHNDYGHYAVINAVKDGKYQVYDPTKGVYYCKTSILDKATNGRPIYYYDVSLK